MRRTPVALAVAAIVVAALAAASPAHGPAPSLPHPLATSPTLAKAVAVQTSNARRLRAAPGIVGTGVGVNRSGQPVIDVFTTRSGVRIPATLGGVHVQTIVTGMIVARSATIRYDRPVPIGVSTGLADFATGTLGARVSNGSTVYALSNNHVFAGVNSASIGDPILQPGPIEDGGTDPADRIATLADYQEIDFSGGANTIDAAIALTTTGDVGTATLPDGYGSPSSTTVSATVGQGVQKYGRTTGLTTGSINAVNVDVDVCYFPLTDTICFPGYEAHFVNQFSIPDGSVPFSASGDSGSLVVTTGSNNPVGLMFAGGDGLTIANPIDAVLQRFNVTIDGGAPSDGKPSAPFNLQAVPGDTQVALSWSAPSNGGSPILEYKIYRSTTSGAETQISTTPPTVTSTSYTDTGLTNGQQYFYKVLAVNAVGPGPLSNEANATPASLVPPSDPLPTIDDFNRGFENPLSDSGRWTNGIDGSGETGLYVPSTWLACANGTTCTAYRNASQYGPDVEVWGRLSVLPGDNNQMRLLARIRQPGSSSYDGYMMRPSQLPGTDQILIERVDNDTFTTLLTVNQELVAGDVYLLRVKGSTLEAWHQSGSTWSRLGVVTDSTYSAAGYVGVGMRGTTGRADDFGARTLGGSATVPGGPTALGASGGNASVSLSWSAPASDGGSPILEYKIYRSTTSGAETQISTTPPTVTSTSYTDTGLTNGQQYFYKVLAVNAVGPGPLSNEANATPASLVSPSDPLPTIDDFNRGFENPLSDSGRWTNGIDGSGETGLYVPSTWLACANGTTCTAYRNASQYGPDVEVWGRLSVLPGDNNQMRLLARIRQPGTSAYDGYMMRPSQLPGTDQILIERVDNDTFTTLLTVNQELVAGDVYLLRVKGSTLEAWHQSGSTWSRLGVVTDSTYSAAGYVGVGMRGTTGRADDFGARTLGGSATVPGGPTALGASGGNASVSLSWSAPASDGGSPILEYKIYRSTTSGAETQISTTPPTVTSTSYTDTGLTNGQQYFYKVLAVNAVGPGPLSNEASATPTAPATVPGQPSGLTATPGDQQVSLSWSAPSDGGSPILEYKIYRSTTSGAETQISTTPPTVTSTSYTDTGLTNGQQYFYKVLAVNAVGPGPLSNEANATPTAPATVPGQPTGLTATPGNQQVSLSWSAPSDGGSPILEYKIYRSTTSGAETQISTTPPTVTSTSYTDTGLTNGQQYFYKVLAVNAVGPGPLSNEANATPVAPATVPGAPTALSALAGDGSVSLSWTPPSSNGGSALTGYRVYRGTSPNPTVALIPDLGLVTSFQDSGLTNGQIYYYKVSALNAIGPSPLSNEANATPTDLVPPVEPLPILDNFNRANENPLSGGGAWGNGILGSSERSLKVVSNQLACDRTTTATAWRKSPQYGPDSEAWATIATLPGNGNSVRLYARLQTPGSSAVDGYMLLFTQASGVDSVALYRITNGSLTSLATVSREITAGSRLLLRARGTALESWVQEGSTWTRIGRVTDATYAGAGYVGVGIRGKTGRLDDFGAR